MISDKWTIALDISPISVIIISFHTILKPLSLLPQIPVSHMAQTRRRGTVMQLQHSRLVKFSHFMVLNVYTAGQLRECHSNLLCFISFCCSKWFYSTDPFITNKQARSGQSGELGRFPVGRANIWAARAVTLSSYTHCLVCVVAICCTLAARAVSWNIQTPEGGATVCHTLIPLPYTSEWPWSPAHIKWLIPGQVWSPCEQTSDFTLITGETKYGQRKKQKSGIW